MPTYLNIFSTFPPKQNFRNLITLCADLQREHHLLLGHLDDYESFDPQLEKFIRTYYGLSQQQIRETSTWGKAHANKPHHLDQMSEEQKRAFKTMLDAKFPQIGPGQFVVPGNAPILRSMPSSDTLAV